MKVFFEPKSQKNKDVSCYNIYEGVGHAKRKVKKIIYCL